MEERLCLIGLSKVLGLGPRRMDTLLSLFGSAKAVWHAKESSLHRIHDIPAPVIECLIHTRQRLNLEKELASLDAQGITTCTFMDEGYPAKLKTIDTAPIVLYVKGLMPDLTRPAIAVIGSRKCTPYGLKIAGDISSELAVAGVTIISGMARGIDSAAHRGCIEGVGRTIAVLGTGVDVVYPRENKRLMEEIIANGAVVSEFPLGTAPEKSHFPRRNRIISGLADGVLVVEAAETSGSLITADLALEQGRDVWAIPGPVTSSLSRGTNRLIKQGAKLIENAGDILEEFNLEAVEKKKRLPALLTPEEAKVLSGLSLTPVSMEDLVQALKMAPADITSTLTFLELRGLVKRLPGQRFVSNT